MLHHRGLLRPALDDEAPAGVGSSFRGGGAGTTNRRRGESQLLSALAAVLQSFGPQVQKEKEAGPDHDQDAVLLGALQSLVTRAQKDPKGLLPRLGNLVKAAQDGQLQPKKKKQQKPQQDKPRPSKPFGDHLDDDYTDEWTVLQKNKKKGKGKGQGQPPDTSSVAPSSSPTWAQRLFPGDKGKGKGMKGKGKGHGKGDKGASKGTTTGHRSNGSETTKAEARIADIASNIFGQHPFVTVAGFKARLEMNTTSPCWVGVRTSIDAKAAGDLALLHEMESVGFIFQSMDEAEPLDSDFAEKVKLITKTNGVAGVGCFYKAVYGKSYPGPPSWARRLLRRRPKPSSPP